MVHTAPQLILSDHLVGARQDRLRYRDPERLCGLQIDHKFEFGRLLDRQIAWLGACVADRSRAVKFADLSYAERIVFGELTARKPVRHALDQCAGAENLDPTR